jgi:hypothetical protein
MYLIDRRNELFDDNDNDKMRFDIHLVSLPLLILKKYIEMNTLSLCLFLFFLCRAGHPMGWSFILEYRRKKKKY